MQHNPSSGSLENVGILSCRCQLVVQHVGETSVLWVGIDMSEVSELPRATTGDFILATLALLVL